MIAESVKTYRNYIGGEWREGSASSPLEVRDPANGELVYYCTNSTVEDARAAVAGGEARLRARRLG